jgi:cation:H+ antiporter
MLDYLLILGGILLLLFGGDWLVKAAIDIALRAKISLLVVGLTVVSFATSAPELLVSLNAAMQGHMDISFGNVIGSNIANIALILGLTAMVFPMSVSDRTMKFDWSVMMLITLLLLAFLLDGKLIFWESLVLVLILVAYNVYQIRSSRRQQREVELEDDQKLLKLWQMLGYLLIGIAALNLAASFW